MSRLRIAGTVMFLAALAAAIVSMGLLFVPGMAVSLLFAVVGCAFFGVDHYRYMEKRAAETPKEEPHADQWYQPNFPETRQGTEWNRKNRANYKPMPRGETPKERTDRRTEAEKRVKFQ